MVITISDTSNKHVALFIVALSHFMLPFMGSSINVALPSIGKEFSIDAILLNWVATSYFLASVMFLIPFGKIADMYGRKKIFTSGLIIFMAASLLSAVSTSAAFLIGFRFLQGFGASMVLSTSVAIITSVTPVTERGKALGVNVAVVYLGQTVGPFLGGVLTQYFGWRSIFYSAIPICMLALLLVFWKLKQEWIEPKEEKFNYASSLIFSLSFLIIMYGLSVIPEKNSIWLISSGVISFLYFVWHETKVKNPLIDINLFTSNRVFAFSNLSTLISFSATYAVVFLLSLYLQYIQMLPPQSAGLILMSKAIAQGVVSPIAGNLSDRGEPKNLASIGMGLQAVALFLFSLLNTQTSLVFIVAVLIILGLGVGIFASPNTNTVMSSVEKKDYGVSSATNATMRQTGNLLSMAIIMSIFALSIGRVEITPQYHGAFLASTRSAFLLYGGICTCGIFASLVRNRFPEPGFVREQKNIIK